MRALLLALPLALLAGGCSLVRSHNGEPEGSGDCMCTMEYRTIGVRVVDAAGQPVTGLAVTVTNTRTGDVLDVDQSNAAPGTTGAYVVLTDSQVQAVSEAGDTLRFHATGGGRTADAEFVVYRDACACHINKRSGPEQITAR